MNKLDKDKRTQIISGLAEGNSLRATARMADKPMPSLLGCGDPTTSSNHSFNLVQNLGWSYRCPSL
jgi:hypothetical protein